MPDSSPKAADLRTIYAQRFDAMRDYRTAVWRIITRDFFQRHIPRDARVLDLGCGYGEFINQIEAGQKFGMDLNPSARAHLGATVTLLEQDCSAPWPLPDASLDVVFTSNFFEHLPDKTTLQRTLAEIRRCLAPGGQLIALGPNIRYLPGEYWDFWDHYLPLTERSLSEGLENLGFSIEEKHPRFLPYRMAGTRPVPMALVGLYLRLPFLWRFFGKQFLVIATRVCPEKISAQRERESALGQDDRGGGGPAARAAEGNAGPVPFLASLAEPAGDGPKTFPDTP